MSFSIVVVDSYTTSFDGLSWGALKSLGELAIYERTTPEDVLNRCAECQAVITNKVVFDKGVICALPELKYIGITATGTNNVDLAYCAERGIAVTNVPAYSSDSVAQMVFALLLNLASKVTEYSQLVKSGKWSESADFCCPKFPIWELAGKKIGIIGCGSIGERVADIATAFGMEVLKAALPERSYEEERVPLSQVLAESDVITLHLPLTPQTHHLINERTLREMKHGAILINTARGDLVDELALADALRSGRIAFAFSDVASVEPIRKDNPLLQAPNILITPHIAWATREARSRLISQVADNLESFLRGERKNRVA